MSRSEKSPTRRRRYNTPRVSDLANLFRRYDFFRMPREPHDMQSAACPVRAVDQAAIVNLDVVRFNYFLAGRSDLWIACWMADSILLAESHRVLVRRRNEIGDLQHGKGIAN